MRDVGFDFDFGFGGDAPASDSGAACSGVVAESGARFLVFFVRARGVRLLAVVFFVVKWFPFRA